MPGPITSMDDVLQFYSQIQWLSRSDQPNPFNILLLGDGFGVDDEQLFCDFIKELKNEFFKIPPFRYCKDYISILYCFTPSLVNEITYPTVGTDGQQIVPTEDSWDTVFLLYQNGFELINPWYGMRIPNVVEKLELPNDFKYLQIPPYVEKTPVGIWFSPLSKSFGAVGIIAKNFNGIGANFSLTVGSDTLIFGDKPDYRFFTISMMGFRTDQSSLNPSIYEGAYVHMFAHELGHSLCLLDEYERPQEIEPLDDTENTSYWVNAVYFEDIEETSGEEIISKLKWRHVLTASEYFGIIGLDNIFSKKTLEDRLGSPIKLPDGKIYEKVPRVGNGEDLHWTQAYVVEGAHFSKKVFRSNFNCKMRHFIYADIFPAPDTNGIIRRDLNIQKKYRYEIDGKYYYGSPEYCKVCNYNIRKHILGWIESSIGSLTRKELNSLFYEEMMPRLKHSFDLENQMYEWGPEHPEHRATNKAFCDIASARIYVMFRCHAKTSNLDIRFVINPIHVCLYFNGIYLDPTFYDFYRVESTGPLRYQRIEADGSISFPKFDEDEIDTTLGLTGDFYELESTFIHYIPREGSYARQGLPMPEGVHDMTLLIYNLTEPWEGWPGPDRATRNHESVAGRGAAVEKYVDIVFEQWCHWNDYLLKGSYPYLKPLDMKIPLREVQKLTISR